MNPKKQTYKNLADSVIEKFHERGIDGCYCDSKEEALEIIKSSLPPKCSISWGGSETLKEIGLFEIIGNPEYTLYDRKTAETKEEEKELYRNIATCDYYFMSSNAITLDGELVNIDGNGNRVACLIYGPEHVVIVAGMNKIVPDVETAVKRIQNTAAPINGVRLNTKTPCASTGHCHNCLSSGCMCCELVVTRKSRTTNRIKVILVGEELGY